MVITAMHMELFWTDDKCSFSRKMFEKIRYLCNTRTLAIIFIFNQQRLYWLGRSSRELNMDSVWREGKGGVAVLWRKELNARINILEELGNDRIIVAQVRLSPTVCMFILSVYLPSSNTSITKYRECLEVLDDVVDNLYEKGIIVLAGDFNGHIGKYGGPRSFDTTNRQD